MRTRAVAGVAGLGILLAGLGLAETGHAVMDQLHPRSTSSAAKQSRPAFATTPAEAAAAVTTSAVHWGTCAPASMPTGANALCATLSVPLDYSHPHGEQIQLALSMVRHTSPLADYQGVVLSNNGGPGAPGRWLATLGTHLPYGAGATYDWVGMDPRGVGASTPLVACDPRYFVGPRLPYRPTTSAQTRRWLARSAAYSQSCAQNSGPLLGHMTTVDWANDLDRVRIALGQNTITYYGYSYGTYLGQVYGTLFPTHVRRMVLDGNVDPERWAYQSNLDQDVAFEKVLRAWFAWLAKNDSIYHLGHTGATVDHRFYAVQRQLQAHPVQAAVGGDEWDDIFVSAGYERSSWANLGRVFSAWANHRQTALLLPWYRYTVDSSELTYPVYLAVQCSDAPWPDQARVLADNHRLASADPFLTWENGWFNAPCLTWPVPAHTPVTVDGSKVRSALLVSETGDAATPYAGSLEVRRLFPNSALLGLPGGTNHADSLTGNTCEDEVIADYLGTGRLPARRPGNRADLTCAPKPTPSPR